MNCKESKAVLLSHFIFNQLDMKSIERTQNGENVEMNAFPGQMNKFNILCYNTI